MPDEPSAPPAEPGAPPSYRRYRARPRLFGDRGDGATPHEPRDARPAANGAPPARRRIAPARIVLWALLAVLGWIALSAALFLVSAQLAQDRVDSATKAELSSAGLPVLSPTTVLILGSDLRAKGDAEPGAATSGPSRSDSIQLLRVGGGHSAKLSIPRDMAVQIPGIGLQKINAAYAAGGPALAVKTVKRFLGIDVDHVVLVSFARFPALVDAMGGIDYTGGCVVSRINGGFRNGGYTLRLKAGTTRIDGRQTLALARTRTNECNPRENDLTRQRRQQKILAAMKRRTLSPTGFVRWPWIAWRAPQAVSTDMGAAGMSGLAATIALAGNAPTRILEPTGSVTLPDGGAALTISDQSRRSQVQRFLDG